MPSSLPASASIEKFNQLDVIQVENEFATAKVALFGAHILSFIPKKDGRDRLWLSKNAILDGSKAIRGGVPICWPWFSDSHGKPEQSLPNHGHVRDQLWKVVDCCETKIGTLITLSPGTTEGKGFDGSAALTLKVLVGETLEISLVTENIGPDAFPVTCALHTYFSISNIETVELKGIDGIYKDKIQQWKQLETPIPYKFSGETDRVHLCQPDEVTIADENFETPIQSSGHDSLVVWNPGHELSISMGDMADDSYKTMLCVETAVTTATDIEPGQAHTLTQIIR